MGITGRFALSELPSLTEEEERGRLRGEGHGHALDPLAVAVFRARVRQIDAELDPASFDFSAVGERIAKQMEETPPTQVFAIDDLQRHVALTMGAYLATGGSLTGAVVLPDPWEIPELREAIEEDARIRKSLATDPGERMVDRIDHLLWRTGFADTIPRTRNDLTVFAATKLGEDPNEVRNTIVGHRGRKGNYSGFVARHILREVFLDHEELNAAMKAAFDALPEGQRNDKLARDLASDAVVKAHRGKGGRPEKLYRYIPAEQRYHWLPVPRDVLEGEA